MAEQPAKRPRVAEVATLLDEFLRDLAEVVAVPFFDNELPFEIVVRVFRFLSVRDLGRCASVSRLWRRASEDDNVWLDVAQRHAWDDLDHWSLRHYEGDIVLLREDGSVAWKNVCWVRHGYQRIMQRNWAERYCAVQTLEGADEDEDEGGKRGRRSSLEEAPPVLSAACFGHDRIFGGTNDGTTRSWTAAEATVDDWIDTRNLSAAASAVRIVLREQPALILPEDDDAGASSEDGVSPPVVRHVTCAGARAFTVMQRLPLDDGADWAEAAAAAATAALRAAAASEGADGHDADHLPAAVRKRREALLDPTVVVWDALSGRAVMTLPLPTDLLPPLAAADAAAAHDAADGHELDHLEAIETAPIAGGVGQRVFLDPPRRRREPARSRSYVDLLPSTDGSRLVGALDDGHLVLWDSRRHGAWEVAHVTRAHGGALSHCAGVRLPGGREGVLTGCNDAAGGARLYVVDPHETRLELQADLPAVDQVLALDADDARLVVASSGLFSARRSKISVFDTLTGAIVCSLNGGETATGHDRPACVHYRGAPPHQLAVGYSDGVVRVFDLRAHQCTATLQRHFGTVLALQMDATKVVSGGNDARTRVFDLRTGSTMWVAEDRHPVQYVRFTDRLLVTASYPMAPSPFTPFSDAFVTPGQLRVMDFSPAANWSRVQVEFTSVFDTGPSVSRRSVIMSAPYTEL